MNAHNRECNKSHQPRENRQIEKESKSLRQTFAAGRVFSTYFFKTTEEGVDNAFQRSEKIVRKRRRKRSEFIPDYSNVDSMPFGMYLRCVFQCEFSDVF